jgi:lysine 2,3-aminomutase
MAEEWKQELKESIRTVEQLNKYLQLSLREKRQIKEVIERHPMRITRHYLSLVDKNDPDDPIRKMVVPSAEEFNLLGQYDTSGELANTIMPGLQHKYAQTALILATNRCATYCRFCFRKRLIGLDTNEIIRRFDDGAKYIAKHGEIDNVLISGGDPLVLPNEVIARFLERLSVIPHLRFVRIGTRSLVTLPDRILADDDFIRMLRHYSLHEKKIMIVTHINHPREITKKLVLAANQLSRSAVTLSNQSVLLKGVNDDAKTMADLQRDLVSIGIQPYYVFQCRSVKRVKHNFQVPLYKGLEVIEGAKRMLDGPSKRFRFVMSHRTGKIEIVGIIGDSMYFRYHQAKDPVKMGKFFMCKLDKTAGWLDEMY